MLKIYLNVYMKKRILPNVTEFHISEIIIAALLLIIVIIKYEAIGKANIQDIKNNI